MRVTQRQLEAMIQYEDEAVLVVHKPPFLAVETRAVGQQDLVSLLKNRAAAKGEPPAVAPVHRLDQPVEGLLVLAKTKQAAAALGRSLQQGDFCKEYIAVVNGVAEESGELVHTLKKDGRTNTSAVVPDTAEGGKRARLSYKRLAIRDEKSLLVIRLDTGRHHQIRVQMAAAGHPLSGDGKYGAQTQAHQPLALCSCRLSFVHPLSGQPMTFTVTPAGAGFAPFAAELTSFFKTQS